jgi:hypothetical protein
VPSEDTEGKEAANDIGNKEVAKDTEGKEAAKDTGKRKRGDE